MERYLLADRNEMELADMRMQIVQKYNWYKVAEQTIKVYENVLATSK